LFYSCVCYCLGAVAIETHEDRMKDYSNYWMKLFGRLEFGDIDAFEANYRGVV